MRKRFDYEDIKLILNNSGLELIADQELIAEEYKNEDQKLITKDINGYLYLISMGNLQVNLKRNSKPDRFRKNNPYIIQNVKLWCELNNKKFELLSNKWDGNNIKLKWKCKICKEEFDMDWSHIHSGNGCPYCRGLKVGLSNCLATKNPELASEWHPTLNGNLTPYDVTENSGKGVWWRCKDNPKHEWRVVISSRNSGCKCPYCIGRYPTEINNLLVCNPSVSLEWDYTKNKNNPEEYCPNSGKKVWWKCKECRYEWITSIASRNGGTGCPECNKSKGEKIIKEFLHKNNIVFETQKTFDGLIGLGGGLLSYDFYLPQYNLLVEYQGLQHEKYVKGFHKSKNDFKRQQEHDLRKKEYSLQNGYNFLEIWYWDFDNIETILKDYK